MAEAEAIAAQRAVLRALPASASERVDIVASVCTDVPSFLHSQPTLTALAGALIPDYWLRLELINRVLRVGPTPCWRSQAMLIVWLMHVPAQVSQESVPGLPMLCGALCFCGRRNRLRCPEASCPRPVKL